MLRPAAHASRLTGNIMQRWVGFRSLSILRCKSGLLPNQCWNVRSRGVDVHRSRESRLWCKTYETHLSLVLMSSLASFVAFQLALPVFICIHWTFAYLELCVYIYSVCRISAILSCRPLFVSLSFDLSFRLLGPERCNLKILKFSSQRNSLAIKSIACRSFFKTLNLVDH